MMKCALLLLLFLLWSLVEVHSQIAPYVTFMGETLPNHSYVDLSRVGWIDSGAEIVCHTDLQTCCGGSAGDDRGHWFFPNGTQLPNGSIFAGSIFASPLVERRRDTWRVDLHRGSIVGYTPSGMYHCFIETVAVHSDDNFDTTTGEAVYVGVYNTGGIICMYAVVHTINYSVWPFMLYIIIRCTWHCLHGHVPFYYKSSNFYSNFLL